MPLKPNGTVRKARRYPLSMQASFLLCAAIIYIGVFGIQYKKFSSSPALSSPEARATRKQRQHTSRDANVDTLGRHGPAHTAVGLIHYEVKFSKPTPEQALYYKEMATMSATNWNLTTPNAVQLLEDQFTKENDYDHEKDFFHFHHLHKSGGTSISGLMDKTMGLPKTGILAGSRPSGNFNHEEALKVIKQHLANGMAIKDLPFRASYAHTGLRPVHGPNQTKTGKFFLKNLPNRRLRVITMLRDPTDFRASNHAMIMCGLNHQVDLWNKHRIREGLEVACSPKDGLNISAVGVDQKIQALLKKCQKADEADAKRETLDESEMIDGQQRKQCADEKNGIDTLVHCRSASHLLASPLYDKHYRSMLHGLMGRFHQGQQFGGTAYGRMGFKYKRAEESVGYSLQTVEEYTLKDLGGLDLTISAAGDDGPPEPDFIWFGITERMKESTVLFYYYFNARPLKRIPVERVQKCKPNSWWSEEDRATVKAREPADYAVWRAANAILDVRMTRMIMEIQARLDVGDTKESMPHVDWSQLDEIGIKWKKSN